MISKLSVVRQRREQGRCNAGQSAVDHHPIADGLGAKFVLADGLKHPSKGRVHDAQQGQKNSCYAQKQQVIADDPAAEINLAEKAW